MNKKGFTLVEMIATVAILGVLSTIAVVSYQNFHKSAEDTYYEKQEELITLAAKDYFSTHRTLLPKTPKTKKFVSLKKLVDDKYIDPVTDYKGISCSDKEKGIIVWVTNVGGGKYTYKTVWKCDNSSQGGDRIGDYDAPEPPTINLDADFKVNIIDGEDSGEDASGVAVTLYDINTETFNNAEADPYVSPFYVSDVLGKISVKAISIDYSGNASEIAERIFYSYALECSERDDEACSSGNLYNGNCKGVYDPSSQKCKYNYQGRLDTVYSCDSGWKRTGTICEQASGSYCSAGDSLSLGQCVKTETFSYDVSGISCCHCEKGKGVAGGICEGTDYGCPSGGSRILTKYAGYSTLSEACRGSCTGGNWGVSVLGICSGTKTSTYTPFLCRKGSYSNGKCVLNATASQSYVCHNAKDRLNGSTCTQNTDPCKMGSTFSPIPLKCYSEREVK